AALWGVLEALWCQPRNGLHRAMPTEAGVVPRRPAAGKGVTRSESPLRPLPSRGGPPGGRPSSADTAPAPLAHTSRVPPVRAVVLAVVRAVVRALVRALAPDQIARDDDALDVARALVDL